MDKEVRESGRKVHRCRPGDRVVVSKIKVRPLVRIGSDKLYYVVLTAGRRTSIKTRETN